MKSEMIKVKTPGSRLAIEHGCTCSPEYNDNGFGMDWFGREWLLNPGCPLHDDELNKTEEKK